MIKVENLSKNFQEKEVLSSVNFSIKQGDIVGIVGRNGAGKSTLLQIMADLIPPDSGKICYDSLVIGKNNVIDFKKELGVFINDQILIEELSADDYLKFICSIYKIRDYDQLIKKYLDIFDFDDIKKFKNKKISTLSVGMRRKVSLISVLMHSPKYLLLDEPFSHLDFKVVDNLVDHLSSIKSSMHIVFSSHILENLMKFSTKILYLESGKIKLYRNKELCDMSKLKLGNIT